MEAVMEQIKEAVHGFAVSVVALLGFSESAAQYVYVFLISILPIVELRGAIPVAFALGLDIVPSYIVSVVGNLLPVPFILLFITPFCNFLKRTKALKWFPEWLEKKAAKNESKVTKYKNLGLFLFVAIPLPGTGAWTGALVASFIGYKFKDAFLAITAGVLTAGVIMTALSFGLIDFVINLFH